MARMRSAELRDHMTAMSSSTRSAKLSRSSVVERNAEVITNETKSAPLPGKNTQLSAMCARSRSRCTLVVPYTSHKSSPLVSAPPLEHKRLLARVEDGPLDERGAAREPERRQQQHHEDEEQVRLAHRRVVRRWTRPVADQVVRECHHYRQKRADEREHQRRQICGRYGAHLR